jgi:hypothetical protein
VCPNGISPQKVNAAVKAELRKHGARYATRTRTPS